MNNRIVPQLFLSVIAIMGFTLAIATQIKPTRALMLHPEEMAWAGLGVGCVSGALNIVSIID